MSGGYGPGGYPGHDPRNRRQAGPRAGFQGPGYGGQDFGGAGYGDQRHDPQAHGDYGDDGDPRGYGQQEGPGDGYPPGPAAGGYRRPPAGYGQRGHDDGQRDDSFLPGFDGRGGYGGGGYDGGGGYGGGGYDGGGYDGGGGYDYGDGYGTGYDDPRGLRGGGPAGPGDWDQRNVRPRKKATRWLPRILVLTIVAAIVVGGLVGGLYIKHKYDARYHPADYVGQGTGEVTVQVKSGDTAFSLAPRLLQLGVIASERAFTNAAENTTTTTANSAGLEAGYYLLHEHMQASLAYAALLNPKNLVQTTVTIPEGKRAVDVIAIIAKRTKIPLKDFQQVLANPAHLGLPSYANGKAEGYLFPATYAIAPHETALQILQAMVQRFNDEANQIGLVAAANAVRLTPTQLITEASLAQSEGGSVSDYPKIAEVIHNRLAIGMHLQFDSTVLYGLGKYAVSATIKQTQTPGPYNTYLNAGLPPGPISNPGDAAIQGILHADHGNWLYFLTVPGGKSQFSATPLKGQ
ncbi:MAG TPA: endolytic transglycosylase MltG [Trebonia sp.]